MESLCISIVCAAVLQVIALRDGLSWKFSFFADRHERFVQVVCNRHSEDEAAGLGSCRSHHSQDFFQHSAADSSMASCSPSASCRMLVTSLKMIPGSGIIRNTYLRNPLTFFIKYSSVSSRFDNSPYSIASIFFCVNFVSDRKQGRKIRYLRLFCIFKNNSGY